MGLFNRKQKTQEIKDDFNYEEMMKAAKVTQLLKSATVKFIQEIVLKNNNEYSPSETETNMLGVYDKNDKLILILSYDLDEKLTSLYMMDYYNNNYCINDTSFSLKLVNPLFKVVEKNTENLPIDLILCYLYINQFTYTFNDFFDMCFFNYTLNNTITNLNKTK